MRPTTSSRWSGSLRPDAGLQGSGPFAVGLVGFFVAFLFGTISGWLFLPALAGGLWLARLVFTLRMGELERELSNMPAPWDRDSR